MSLLSTLGNVFGGLTFTSALGLLIVSMSLAQFTDFPTLQPLMTKILAEGIRRQTSATDINSQATALKAVCSSSGNSTIEVPAGDPLGKLELQCDKILATENSDFPNIYATAAFDKLYNRKYTCDFLQCVQTLQGNDKYTVIISSTANIFFHSIILPLAAATILGAVFIIVSLRKWQGILKSIGISCIFVGITYFTFPIIQLAANNFARAQQVTSIDPILTTLFEPMKFNLLIVLIAGIVLTILGYVGAYSERRKMSKILQK